MRHRAIGGWGAEGGPSVGTVRDRPAADSGEQYYYLPLELSSLHPFPPPYQLQVELEGLDGGFSQGGAGFVVGDVAFDGMRPAAGRMCWLHANAVGIDLGMTKPEWTFSNTSMMNAVTAKRHLDLRVWSGSLVLLADQQGPFALPAGPFEPGDRVGLGTHHNSTALRVRFSGVRIRKLPYGPLMELRDNQVLLQEAAKMVDLDPDDWFARFVRGTTYFQLQRFDKALVDLRELARLQPDADGVFFYTGMTLAALSNTTKPSPCSSGPWRRTRRTTPCCAAGPNWNWTATTRGSAIRSRPWNGL